MSTERRRKHPSPVTRRALQWREQTGSLRGGGKPGCSRHGRQSEKSKDRSLCACVSQGDLEQRMKTFSNSYIPALGYRWLTRFYDPLSGLRLVRLHSKKRCCVKRAFTMDTECSIWAAEPALSPSW
jgi:hypothetical protein